LDISVIIPTFQRDVFLKNTLRDLLNQKGDFSFEVIVIDQNNPSVELRDSELYALSKEPHIRWIGSIPPGVVYARNKAVSLARGEILVFIDDDVEIKDAEFLSKHLRTHLELDHRIAAVCGRELNKGRPNFVDQLGYQREGPLCDILHFPRNYRKRIEATVLSTSNSSVKKNAMLEVGCFDENFGGASYGDDADLALRLVKKGHRIIYDPSPTLLHLMAPAGGVRLSAPNSFSDTDKALCGLLFYLRHIHKEHKEFRFFYIHQYILKRTLLLKRNLLRPWRLLAVLWGLIRAFFIARTLATQEPKCSFRPDGR